MHQINYKNYLLNNENYLSSNKNVLSTLALSRPLNHKTKICHTQSSKKIYNIWVGKL